MFWRSALLAACVQDAGSQGLMSYEADFINARHTAKRKAAQRSERKEYFPIPLNSQGMMVRSVAQVYAVTRCS